MKMPEVVAPVPAVAAPVRTVKSLKIRTGIKAGLAEGCAVG